MRPRGARPTPRHQLAAAIPHRFTGPTPPQFITIPSRLSMWMNGPDPGSPIPNGTGDCVSAEEAFKCACASVMAGQPEIFITDQTLYAWASKHGVLNGAVIKDVLDWMTQQGFSQDGVLYGDGPATSVDWTNPGLLQNAIAQGPVKIGVAANQLENVVGSKNGWFATGFQHDPNIDHCVSLCGYGSMSWLASALGVSVPPTLSGGAPAYALFTWNTIGVIDVPSMLAITSEAWLRSPSTVISGTPPPPGPGPSPISPTLAQVLRVVDGEFATLERSAPWVAGLLAQVNRMVDQAIIASW